MTEAPGAAAATLPRRSPLWQDAVSLLTGYAPTDPQQREWRAAYLCALEDDLAIFKPGPPVHLTASCLVLDEARERVLLTFHGKAHKWLQFGGHLEVTDPSVHAAAVRETREESGIGSITVSPDIVQLHRHALGARFGRCEAHLDVRFVGSAPPGADPVCSPESLAVRWWPIGALPDDLEDEIRTLITLARSHG